MSWLRTTSLSFTFARQLSRSLDPRHDYEPHACYNSFCKHWQQAHDIILKSQPQHLHDDVLGVVNHLEQLSTLLVLEARAREINTASSPAACLDYLLSENLLDKLYEWAVCTGKYENVVRLEQLKLFGHLISHYSTQVIAAEPLLRPLLKLLSGFRNELPPANVEGELVTVLNQLCVALMQNMKFSDLFFLTIHTPRGSHSEFIIVRLLLTSVHREGSTGSTARDALLLCAKMSARCKELAEFMLSGNTCPVLATGLSGLYSLLPRVLDDKIYRLTPDDVNQVHKLMLFIDSLEFCNAVAQVAHPAIKKHLMDLLYQGFLVPVMGPALLQTKRAPLQSGVDEQAAAMAYLELILRCVTRWGLLRSVLHFLFVYEYDGVRVIDILLRRLDGNSQLSLIALSVMETLIDLNCEDVMIDMVFKHLVSGHHLNAKCRHRITEPALYRNAAVTFLGLSPKCCSRPMEKTRQWCNELALCGRRVLDFNQERRINGVHDESAMNHLAHDAKVHYGNPNETLYSNYHAYICDSRFQIVSRVLACSNWTSKYDSVIQKSETNNNIKATTETADAQTLTKEQDSLLSCTSGYETKDNNNSENQPNSLTSLNEQSEAKIELIQNKNEALNEQTNEVNEATSEGLNEGKEHDSLTSLGESSGYESFKYKEGDDSEGYAEELFRKSFRKKEVREYDGEPLVRNWKASGESTIGPLLTTLLKKTSALLESDLVVNFRVTSVLSKLSSLPAPLLTSLLLSPSGGLQPNVPSLLQTLTTLKEEVDELTSGLDNSEELVDRARVYLIQREMALVKTRTQTNDDNHARDASPVQQQRPDDSPFKRMENKRRSFSNSISNIFGRRLSSSSPSNVHSLQHTNYASPQRHPDFTQESYWNQSITLRSILNAVILDEWLKELAALCEEHALRLSAENYQDESYLQSVAL